MAYKKLQIRRGAKANLPTLSEGELGYCTDTKEVYVGSGRGNTQLAKQTELNEHANNADMHVTADEKAAWNESDVFIATYGTTTSAEIEAAYQSGKAVFCKKGSYLFVFVSRLDENTHVFSSVDATSSSIAV